MIDDGNDEEEDDDDMSSVASYGSDVDNDDGAEVQAAGRMREI